MARSKILALILAGGRGSRMEVLTDFRAKPALPYAGVYRLIDISLSNLRNSGISDVRVVVQYETNSIVDELANGRPWDLDRTHGGLQVIPPQQHGADEDQDHLVPKGNADAILANLDVIRKADPDVVLVLSADHIYRLDYNLPIEQHLESGADVTLVTTRVPIEEASNYGTCRVDGDGRVTDFVYKPEESESDIVTTEVFVYNPHSLIQTLQRIAKEKNGHLEDFGHELIPSLVESGKVFEYRLDGYWKDVGRPEAYFHSHMELLDEKPGLDLDDAAWPVFTLEHQRLPARIYKSARIEESLISPGCHVRGAVERSVLAPGAIVEEGATVRNAIVLEGTVVRSGATVQYAIVDRHVTVGEDARIGKPFEGESLASDDLALVGQYASIPDSGKVGSGDRIKGIDPLHRDNG